MRKVNLALFGFITVLIVGLAVVLSQKTLFAQQDAAAEASTVKSHSKILKKIKHKDKKQLKKENNNGDLTQGKKTEVKETVKTANEGKDKTGEKLDSKNDK